ncbi:hypothetical protein [Bradyrhizobium sp. 63_E2_N1_3]|uniref:hypothetical protein n=1 Tax=Bradyrhizobium sp. 63_E2_N1_3 TaxID=3240373 RepID=UPI003F895C55
MAKDDTAALVVALSAQVSQFERDMKRANDIADRTVGQIEGRFSNLLGASTLGNLFGNIATKGLEKAVSVLDDLLDRFVKLTQIAHLVQVPIQDVFGIQESASKDGASVDEAAQSIRSLAVLLDQMKRGQTNTLTELFDVNPAALRGVNVEALTLQQTFGIIANLVQNAETNIQKLDVLKAAGQAESMAKFLQRGADETARLAKNAADAAPDLQRIADSAKLFDEAWKTAVQNVKAYLAENFLGVFKQDLQDIVSLLSLATKFLALFKGGPLGEQTASLAADLERMKTSIEDLSNRAKTAGRISEDKPAAAAPGGGTSTRDPSRPLTRIPLAGDKETQDSFDRTEEQITRQTALINADTIAVAQNNSVRAQLRAEFALLNAIRKDEGEVTQEQIDRYVALRGSMSAELALEQAKIDLTPAHKASFMAAAEGAATATAAYDQAREAVSKLNSASSQVGSALSSAFADAVVEGKGLGDVLTSLAKQLEKMAISSAFGSIFNAPASGGLSPVASFFQALIPKFAGGTDFAPGGMALVGERGPELVNLPRGSQVIPNDVARRGGSSGATIQNVFHVGGDVGPGTIEKLQAAVVAAHRKVDQVNSVLVSTQRMQQTGVG